MTMPDFLVIGGKRCATTALYRCIRQHPQIYMPKKEVHFFSLEGKKASRSDYITDINSYRALFSGGPHGAKKGEASPSYLHWPGAAERIRGYIPEVKLVAILRNPAERAYSDFLHERRAGRETSQNFDQALSADENRTRFHYTLKGFYYKHLKQYFDLFAQEQIRIFLYDDFCADPGAIAMDIFRFLAIDDTFTPDCSVRDKASGIPRSQTLHAFLSRPSALKALAKLVMPRRMYIRIGFKLHNHNIVRPPFPTESLKRLTDEYREDILKLQDLIQRDLSHWLEA